jgi:DNA-binding NarL/FixJ family response regulator
MILAVVDDLLFLSKIQEAAKHLGVAVKSARPTDLPDLAIQDVPSAIIIDLNHRSGKVLEVLRTLKSDLKTKGIAVIGFVSHVQSDLIAAARDAGCDLVLARSAFVSQLPSLLQRFSGTGTAGRTADMEDIHRALFPQQAPRSRTLDELKQGIRQHVRERHPRR